MRKRLIFYLVTIFVTWVGFSSQGCSTLTGISSSPTSGNYGLLYSDIVDSKLDTIPTGEVPWSLDLKIGKSICKQYMYLVALGDCSVERAMRNGKISKVHHVDFEIHNIVFFYVENVTKVYGM